ncbi:MAG TPA: SUKH-4 family immunity protein [Burkholderiaceae bacterium]
MKSDFKETEGCEYHRWVTSNLSDVDISLPDKDFLIHTGCPIDVDWSLEFSPVGSIPLERASLDGLRIIGYDNGSEICIDERDNGSVVAVENGGKVRPINSNVVKFSDFLTLYKKYRRLVQGLDDDSAMSLIDAIEAEMRAIDEGAFSTVEYWWPVIIEQVREGNL